MVLVVFFLTYQLRNALPDFIRTYEFTGFKRESRAAFCTAAFLFKNISLNIMYLVGICICYVF